MFRKLEKNFDLTFSLFYFINSDNHDNERRKKSVNNNEIKMITNGDYSIPRTISSCSSEKIDGLIYFRSDTRPPSQIFKTGFSPRMKMGQFWWTEAIKSRGFKDKCGINYKATDADPEVCVCMTTNIKSAAIFPLKDEENTYIYVIALPESTKINYLNNGAYIEGKENVEICRKLNTPLNIKEVVFDLYNFQIEQTRNVCSFFSDKGINDPSIINYAGWPLYAFEAIAYKIQPHSVVCAIECKRKPLENREISCSVISNQPIRLFDRKFTLGEIIENENFSETANYQTQSDQHSISFKSQKENVVSEIKKMQNIVQDTNNTFDVNRVKI